MRYVAIKPKAYSDFMDQPPIASATTVYETDDKPEETGLFDMHGTPLYRIKDKLKMGFV
jgi:hypothetical protein